MADSTPTPHEDLELVRRALERDAQAIQAVVERMRCVHRILALRNLRLGEPFGPGELEDIAQEVMTAVWGKLALYQGRSSLDGWIYRFAQLELVYSLRRKDRRLERPVGLGQGVSARADEPLEPDEAETLYPALEELDPDQADVLRLKHFEDLTFQEIGRRLGLSSNTAKTRYYRGLQRLRTILRRLRPGPRKVKP